MKKILIAEDSSSWQNVHKELLTKYDKAEIQYTIFPCAVDAYEHIKNDKLSQYDLIITDLQMETEFLPQFAGEWLVENIKQLPAYKTTPLVIVSAAYNISFIAEKLGVGYLSKRFLVNSPDNYFFMLDENLQL